MLSFTATLYKFADQGEKTGWTYVEIPAHLAAELKPNYKKSFRIKGKIDSYVFKGAAVMPMGEGDYIFAINGEFRKHIRKQKGDTVTLQIEEDTEKYQLSIDLVLCLDEDPEAKAFFDTLAPSHQNYFSKWIESAKTEATKTKRLTQSINAFSQKLSYGEMIRANKNQNL